MVIISHLATGEMVEWSITAVLKTAVPRGTGGSNPSLSANKGVNQQFMRFTPFSIPKNLRGVKRVKRVVIGKISITNRLSKRFIGVSFVDQILCLVYLLSII